jgi:transcriptional regulator GlxA family with amidase domain
MLSATRRYKAAKRDIDTLIVPDGSGPQASQRREVLVWLREISRKVRRVVSICTGAFLLARAGLLDGRRVTTHWKFANELARQYPKLTVEGDRIYIQDGQLYTSAGVTAGMDLALALVEEDLGSALALQVARTLALFLRRPGSQNQFSTLLSAQASDRKPFRELSVWVTENLQQNLSVDELAYRVAMIPRNFARVFVREFGTTPARFVENLRLEASRPMLQTTRKSAKEIAGAVGFHSAEVMRRAFERNIGISPTRHRELFAHTSRNKVGPLHR